MKLIRGYQIAISPLLGSSCRFHPTCSSYMLLSIERFGLIKGLWLGFRRLSKCHPFHKGGIDEVPEATFNTARKYTPPLSKKRTSKKN